MHGYRRKVSIVKTMPRKRVYLKKIIITTQKLQFMHLSYMYIHTKYIFKTYAIKFQTIRIKQNILMIKLLHVCIFMSIKNFKTSEGK